MIPQLPTPRPGRQLSAKALTQVFDQAAGFRVSVDQPPVDQLPYSWRGFRRFPARLTRESDNADGSYDWTEQLAAEDGTWADLPAGRGGTSYASAGPDTLNPAWEDNLTSGIAADPDTGTVVWMEEGWLDDSGGGADLDYRFSLAGGGGGGGGGSRSYASAVLNTDQTIPSGVLTQITDPTQWTVEADTDSYWQAANAAFEATGAIFQANIHVSGMAGGTLSLYIAQIIGGTTVVSIQSVPVPLTNMDDIYLNCTAILTVPVAGNQYALLVYQNSGADVTLTGDAQTRMAVTPCAVF